MKHLLGFAAGLALASLPTSASAQCNCNLSSLIGESVKTRAGTGPAVTSLVGTGVEIPAGGTALGMVAPQPQIDFDSKTIRISFLQQGTYGPGSTLSFEDLKPKAAPHCTGPVEIAGYTVYTPKPTANFVITGVTKGPNQIGIQISPPSGSFTWGPGTNDYILITLNWKCGSPPPPPPPPGFSACCPPWNSAQLAAMLFYQPSGSVGAPYQVKFKPTPLLHTQMNAYVNYLKSLGLGFTQIGINYRLIDAGAGLAPVPGAQMTMQPLWWNGTATPTANIFPNNLSPNHWYRIEASIMLTPGPSGFLPKECLISYVDVNWRLVASRSSETGGIMSLRFPDGRTVERPTG